MDETKTMEDTQPLTKGNIKNVHATTCGGLLGSKKIVDKFLTL